MIQDTVVIGGECSLETRIEGDCDLTSMVEGDPDVLVVEGGGQTYPHYSGSYTVNPSTSQQVLQTDGKVMDDDVTVQAVQAGSATTPATIITADPTISVSSGGLITATVSKTQQITPTVVEGYVETGTAGNVGVSGSNTEQLSVQGAQTIHPSSSDQSIASGKYLTGAQTFKAVTVSGLTADKVLQGNTVKIGDADDDDRIMSVTGTAQGGITPTGTKQISITQNGTTTEDVTNYASAEITVNVSGGGGTAQVATGSFTLASDFSLTTSAQTLPGLDLDFQPDILIWIISRTSFDLLTPSGNHVYGMFAMKKSLLPYMLNSIVSTVTGDYQISLYQTTSANADSPSGYAIDRYSNLSSTYYPRFSINADGTVSVGRYSSASSSIYAGTYSYWAVKL